MNNTTEEFKAIARALAPYFSDTYDLLNAADKVQKALAGAPVAQMTADDPWRGTR